MELSHKLNSYLGAVLDLADFDFRKTSFFDCAKAAILNKIKSVVNDFFIRTILVSKLTQYFYDMKIFCDQLNRPISLANSPQRIISLVPSQTELLYDLGVEQKLIGRTKFCIHPSEKVKNIQRIGGTKNLNIDLIKSLQPDLIIANKEENTKEQIDELAKHFPVWISDIKNLEEAFDMITKLGELLEVADKSIALVHSIQQKFAALQKFETKKAIYFIWQNPYISIGADTFIHDMMRCSGSENMLQNKNRYPEISEAEIKNSEAEYLLLSSEPYPFKEKQKQEFEKLFPTKKIILVDGEMFSWYGSRLVKAADYFLQLQNEMA
jgi:ABC-type Fe3+-hydroxamate transport system substrate-binding protein